MWWAWSVMACTSLGASSAAALPPEPGMLFQAQDHHVAGQKWHVEFRVSGDPGRLRSVVAHSERCGETTVFKDVPVAPDGSVSLVRSSPATSAEGTAQTATWRIAARFVEPWAVRGTFRMGEPDCDSGLKGFTVPVTGGRAAVEGGHHGHRHHSAPLDYPKLSSAPATRRGEVRGLWKSTLAVARRRFATYAAARRVRFVPSERPARPSLVHLRTAAYTRDRSVLDPRRPESLVYWWPRTGAPVLVAFMYRAPAGKPPRLGRPILSWHQHRSGAQRAGATQMTHIWLTDDLRSAAANCLPVPELERALPAFRYEPPARPSTIESSPCPHYAELAAPTH
jgi:hypothetical protein